MVLVLSQTENNLFNKIVHFVVFAPIKILNSYFLKDILEPKIEYLMKDKPYTHTQKQKNSWQSRGISGSQVIETYIVLHAD